MFFVEMFPNTLHASALYQSSLFNNFYFIYKNIA